MMRFHSWWENLGCAPIYRRYDLAVEFRQGDISAVVKTAADITGWLPGDIVYDDVAPVPYDLPAGEYTVRVAMLDRQTGRPGITLAQDGGSDGWYELCNVEIE